MYSIHQILQYEISNEVKMEKENNEIKSLHIYCPKGFLKRVRAYADSKGLTVSAMMRLAVIERMEQDTK
jgi:hypothetical protein